MASNATFWVWVVAIGLAWAFTFYVFRVYQPVGPNDPILFGDLGPVWLGLTGLAFIFTAYQVSRWFWLLAIVHLVVALLMELSSRGLVKIDFLDANQPILVGVVDGGLMLVAAVGGLVLSTRRPTNASINY